jgi:hypothetical protein
VPAITCPACGKPISDAAAACPHCGKPAGRAGGRRGLPVWGKILLVLLLAAAPLGLFAAGKPSEAELRQAIRDKAKDLQAKGLVGPPLLIDDPQYAGRFTYHAHFFTSEITFTSDDGKVIPVATGQIGDVTVKESW